MKTILGLDLGTNSIGWALINEAENSTEKSSIIKLGVRVNPLTIDEIKNFEKGKSITTNADRTLKRSMRRSLQRYKLRRQNLMDLLIEKGIIFENSCLTENINKTTFETYRLRAKAVNEKISLEEFGRVLLMLNKKRGYKSSRKVKLNEEGQIIDGMQIAKKLYEEDLTPGQYIFGLIKSGVKKIPDFYRSDLEMEFEKIWNYQKAFYIDFLTDEIKQEIKGKSRKIVSAILWNRFKVSTVEIKGDRNQKKYLTFQLRNDAIKQKITLEECALVLAEVNNDINNYSGYLGAISDRSKELYFMNLTIGQYLLNKLNQSPNFSLKNIIFYRQDYLDEFERIWTKQSEFFPQLNLELKKEIRDIIIFYQRRLKSQKGLVNYCEFENQTIVKLIDGKPKTIRIGAKVSPKSSPIFQEFKIWQVLNNIEVKNKKTHSVRLLEINEKNRIFNQLKLNEKLSKEQVLRMLFDSPQEFDLNFNFIDGNKTFVEIFKSFEKIVETSGHGEYDFSVMDFEDVLNLLNSVFYTLNIDCEILDFSADVENPEKQKFYKLWHLLYSYEGDNSISGNDKLEIKLKELYGIEKEFATYISNVTFKDDYSNLSSKAMKKIIPFLKSGNRYDTACIYAGYNHSKKSLTKQEIECKVLKNKLSILPKNSLRNPVVEKILNQMVNLINSIIDEYGKPHEIRIELARELKKNAKEREELTKNIGKLTDMNETIRKKLQNEFGLRYVSKNDIIRYKLYEELSFNGYHTLYSNTYVPQEKLFSKEFDIEHIIPQSRLFDDSFSNKTLELRSINIEKGNETAFDYIDKKYGEEGVEKYNKIIFDLLKNERISKSKYYKLKMKGESIPDDFIERDIKDTQYIAKVAKNLLEDLVKEVVSTSGGVTDRLRQDWGLIDIMKELNWDKFNKLGLTEIIENKEGVRIYRIKDWTKRNDHRHHAMDALTVAFTKRSHIQYLNNLNAKSDKSSSIYGIESKELERDEKGKMKFKPPIPINEFRADAKHHLENILVSIKAKNKVVTKNTNTTKRLNGTNKKIQLTPRGQLHNETIYGSRLEYVTKFETINGSFDEAKLCKVATKKYREALIQRLNEFKGDPKLAFTGQNSISKNPVFIDYSKQVKVPDKVKIVELENTYTIKKEVNKDLNIEKIVDPKIKVLIQKRLEQYNGDKTKAFSNLELNPIWLNKEKGISIKRVKIYGVNNVETLHEKKDKYGKIILNENGKPISADFVSTSNNHHVAIYRDQNGNLQENVVSFFEAVHRANLNLPIIDKKYKNDEGWEFLFSMKQNEYFIFPNKNTGFNPSEIDLLDESNYSLISPNLFRVQKFTIKDYFFRHHLETNVENNNNLKTISWIRVGLAGLSSVTKVRINHLGKIVFIGEY